MSHTFEADTKFGKLAINYIDNDAGVAALDLLTKQKVIGWDTETTYKEGYEDDKQAGLDPHRSRLRLTQFATSEREIFIFDHFKVPAFINRAVKDLHQSLLPVKVGHNIKFDIKMSRKHLDVEHFGAVFCTELGYRLTKCGQYFAGRVSLQDAVREHLGVELEKELQRSDWSKWELTPEQLVYGAVDSFSVLPLRDKLIEIINELKLRYAAQIDFNVLDPTASIELAGFYLDRDKWVKVDNDMKVRRLIVMEDIIETFRREGAIPQLGLFEGAPVGGVKKGNKGRVNPITSPKQIREFLEACGIVVPTMKDKKTQITRKTTNSVWLKPLKNTYKVIEMLLEFRELDKRKTSYGAAYCDAHINPVTGRIHADYDPQGTKTARFTNSKPNLQQIPTLQVYRDCFRPALGKVFVNADYSQIELRFAAEFSGERGYIDAFLSGEDFHDQTTEKIFHITEAEGKEAFKAQRLIAKRINFGIIYDIGLGKLSLQTGLTEAESKVQLDNYNRTFLTLNQYLTRIGNECARNHEIRTWSGRLVKFWVNPKDYVSVGQAKRNGRNTPIQGGAGEILKLAMRLVFDRIWQSGKAATMSLVHTIHDELIIECDEADAPLAVQILESSMIEAGQMILKNVPVKVDATISAEGWKK